MKFLIFNIAVVGALAYLIMHDGSRPAGLPTLDEIASKAERTLQRASAKIQGSEDERALAEVTGPASEGEKSAAGLPVSPATTGQSMIEHLVVDMDGKPPARRTAMAHDISQVDAPMIDPDEATPVERISADTAPKSVEVIAPDAADPAQPASAQKLPTEVAGRRAEVLGEVPTALPGSAQPSADRRRQLLDLAEEMEYRAAEFAVR